MGVAKHIRHGFCVLFVASALASAAQAATLSRSERTMVNAVNDVRAAHNLRPLRIDATLVRAARDYSATLIRRDIFTHGALGPRLASYGASGPLFGENLAWGTGERATAGAFLQCLDGKPRSPRQPAAAYLDPDRDRRPHRHLPRLRRRDRRHRRLRRLRATRSRPSTRGARSASRAGARHARRAPAGRAAHERAAPARPG